MLEAIREYPEESEHEYGDVLHGMRLSYAGMRPYLHKAVVLVSLKAWERSVRKLRTERFFICLSGARKHAGT